MTHTDTVDVWRRYWARCHAGSRRLQVERAASDPLDAWLVADAATLVADEFGVDPVDVRRRPDAVLAAAREGFADFVAAREVDGLTDARYGYDLLSIHLTTLRRIPGVDPGGVDPVADGNALVLLSGVPVVEEPVVSVRAAVLTYRCPRGHELVVRQSPLEHWTVETCGEPGCTAPVLPDTTRTRVRRVCRFAVEADGTRLPCVATGRYAAASDDAVRLAGAERLELAGVLRPVTDDGSTVEPTVEVLHAEPV